MNRILKFIKIFIVSILFLLFYRMFFIYQINLSVLSNYEKLGELKLINSEFLSYAKQDLSFQNYDDITKKISKFRKNLNEILMYDYPSFYFTDKKFDFDTIKFNFSEEEKILNHINNLFSIGLISLKNLQDSLKNSSQSSELMLINSKIFAFKDYDKDIFLKIKNELTNFKTQDMQARIYVKNAIDYFEILSTLKNLREKLKNINSIEILEKNGEIFKSYIKNIQNEFLLDLSIFFVFFFIFILIQYFSLKIAKTKISEIDKLNQIIDASISSLIITNLKNEIIYVNKNFEKTTGYRFDEIYMKNAKILKSTHHSNEFYVDIFDKITKGEKWECEEFISKRKDGSLLYEKAIIFPIFIDQKIKNYCAIKFDSTKEKKILEELQNKNKTILEHAYTDKLTGFYNLTALNEKIHSNENGVVIYLNINNFTNLRYFYKTDIINQIIQEFSKTIKLCLETYKINAKIFRLQLDEFCIWYEGKDPQNIVLYVDSYFKDKAFYLSPTLLIPPLGITFGISSDKNLPNNDKLYQAIFANNEARDKNEKLVIYTKDNEFEKFYAKNQMVSNMIQYALTNNKVIIECQAIYDITRMEGNKFKIYSYEILVRILDQQGKTHYPSEFLDVAKHTFLYLPITKAVIEKAFWLIDEFPHRNFSINLSSIDIANQKIKEFFLQKLTQTQNAKNLCVEILESEKIDNYDEMLPFITEIKQFGCKISIDDFGSGYSNYFRILELDVNNIKIDGSIIRRIVKDKNSVAVTQTIVDFAKKQNYNVIAEHVSEPEIYEKVKELGIKYIQGFILAKPVLPEYIS